MRPRRPLLVLLSVLVLASLCGCAMRPVKPWERGRLAERRMQFDPDGMQAAFAEHVRFSKEGASGRLSAAGGGCGCN